MKINLLGCTRLREKELHEGRGGGPRLMSDQDAVSLSSVFLENFR